MKKIIYVTSLCALLISGCSTINNLRTFGTDPLVVAATENPRATKTSVMAIGKLPVKTQSTKKINGTCYEFQLNKGHSSSPFYIAFNQKDQVVAAAFLTCNEAEARGIISSDLPYSERKK